MKKVSRCHCFSDVIIIVNVTAFSKQLWGCYLDYATVYADGRMTFTFKNGQTIGG